MMIQAKQHLQNNNFVILGGFLSPSHDFYVKSKFRATKNWIPKSHRVNIIKQSLENGKK